jgi:hypothetical protein
MRGDFVPALTLLVKWRPSLVEAARWPIRHKGGLTLGSAYFILLSQEFESSETRRGLAALSRVRD